MATVQDDEVAWIRNDTARGNSIRSALPGGFAVYGLLDIDEDERPSEDLLLTALGVDPDEVLVAGWIVRSGWMTEPGDHHVLYSGWAYRCRHLTASAIEHRPSVGDGAFPDLLFPADRRWLVSTLWDDSWRSIGTSVARSLEFDRLLPTFARIGPDVDIATTGRELR